MPDSQAREWIAAVAVLVAIGIAFVQAYIQRQKQKQDLFDKRFKIYEEAIAYLVLKLHDLGKCNMQTHLDQYRKNTDSAEWLFGSDVFEHIKEIGGTGLELHRVQGELEHCIASTSVRVTGSQQDDMDRRFNDCLDRIGPLNHEVHELLLKAIRFFEGETKRIFTPYLKLHHNLPWHVRLEQWMGEVSDRSDKAMKARYKA